MSFRRITGAGSTFKLSVYAELLQRSASRETWGTPIGIKGCEIARLFDEGAQENVIRRGSPMVLKIRSICGVAFLLSSLVAAIASGTAASPRQAKAQGTAGLGFGLDATEANVLEVVKLV